MEPNQALRLQTFLDRETLFDLVRRERFARDQRRFDVMRACFHRDAYVRTSWYEGRGGDAYVEATRAWMGNTGNSKHWVFPAFARVSGDRATVESPAMIFNRARLHGVEVDFHVFCRFFSRAVREEGDWKLLSFEVLFERDVMKPVNPAEPLPVDWALLETLRPAYKFLAYIQSARGVTVNPDLLGDDQPDRLEAFHAEEEKWLAGGA
ncbi:MAG: nuclear transport factor 2 family protein [Alphaproteobacteria bacterium]|nr:nuclear transport factor 2 family protein [Rhizobiaceae bacterium]MBU3962005.1 nuclear transport factor 2 family protein [Alphaproteobacteria bacterium]MBU4050369.1 nuclear transport factor 2 family protein [Alphaproteobacteria bacterium]MBU4088133.1 nuclear transport factor 2 family protein [Alphaproteobacteria bacterium]MBU4158456.1 nuclear transport factor 2 family protein [Alphaproteobacteria bacterium]